MARDVEKDIGMNTVVGKGSTLEGTFHIESSVRIDGVLKGELTCSDTVVVGKDGDVEANLKVKNAIIGGRVVGAIVADNRVILQATSSLLGDLKAKLLVVEEGAILKGNCDLGDSEVLSNLSSEPFVPIEEAAEAETEAES